jgi:hypothetical protein
MTPELTDPYRGGTLSLLLSLCHAQTPCSDEGPSPSSRRCRIWTVCGRLTQGQSSGRPTKEWKREPFEATANTLLLL